MWSGGSPPETAPHLGNGGRVGVTHLFSSFSPILAHQGVAIHRPGDLGTTETSSPKLWTQETLGWEAGMFSICLCSLLCRGQSLLLSSVVETVCKDTDPLVRAPSPVHHPLSKGSPLKSLGIFIFLKSYFCLMMGLRVPVINCGHRHADTAPHPWT